MFKSSALTLLFLTAALVRCDNPWRLCPGTPTDKVQVNSVTASPWPMMKGKQVSCRIVGLAMTPITQRNARLDVFTQSVKVYSSFAGPAYAAARGNTYDYSLVIDLPSFIPPGQFDIRISAVDPNGNSITCIELVAQF